jgi:hypothetical protein
VRQRRILQGFSVAVLGFALACAPMALAGASHKSKGHHKAKHHPTKTTKAGLNPGSKLCLTVEQAESGSANVGSSIEKAMEQGLASGNYASIKAAMLTAMKASTKDESEALSALSGAPANVQTAMKGLFSFVGNYEKAIENSTSIQQLATSLGTATSTSQVEQDALTVTNYVTAQCGTTTTTSVSIP